MFSLQLATSKRHPILDMKPQLGFEEKVKNEEEVETHNDPIRESELDVKRSTIKHEVNFHVTKSQAAK
ncbi:hypothetical protein J1N35_000640 [Gossypium stocksii]|uniref:Uncharacterized protein n=1 Tax=Gossypium stocksii TaxID=47602 RepID=A0A9D3WHG2_9ROSI|nr:hypothetical protein J1N35_000640 [Gossypium stocksii]